MRDQVRGTRYRWRSFAAVLIVVIGAFSLLQGLLVVLGQGPAGVDGTRLVLVDLTTWGTASVGAGTVLILTGLGLLLVSTAARFVAVPLVVLHAVAQLVSLPAGPAWSLLIVGLAMVALFALVAPAPAVEPVPPAVEPVPADRPPHRARHYADASLAPRPRRPDRRRLLLPAGSTVYASASATGQPPLARVTLVRPTEVTRAPSGTGERASGARATARVPEPASGPAVRVPDQPADRACPADPGPPAGPAGEPDTALIGALPGPQPEPAPTGEPADVLRLDPEPVVEPYHDVPLDPDIPVGAAHDLLPGAHPGVGPDDDDLLLAPEAEGRPDGAANGGPDDDDLLLGLDAEGGAADGGLVSGGSGRHQPPA